MKIARNTYNQILRFIAGIAAALILVSAVVLTGGMPKGKISSGIFYETTGLHPDGVMMTVNQQNVTVEEYLYWVSYYCEYYYNYLGYMGITDWDAELAENMTAGEYITEQAKQQAINMIVQYEVVERWAAEKGLYLTEDDLEGVSAQRTATVEGLGGEDAYAEWLTQRGVTDQFVSDTAAHTYIIGHLYDAYCNAEGMLYPSAEEREMYVKENCLLMARMVGFDVCEDEDVAAATALAEECASRLNATADPAEEMTAIGDELQQDTTAVMLKGNDGDELCTAAAALEVGEVSELIKDGDMLYLALRVEMDDEQLAAAMLDEEYAARCSSAVVAYNHSLYDTLDVGTFYQALLEARQ